MSPVLRFNLVLKLAEISNTVGELGILVGPLRNTSDTKNSARGLQLDSIQCSTQKHGETSESTTLLFYHRS